MTGGTGTTRTVTVNTGTGEGTVGLNVIDDNSIVDGAGNPLGTPAELHRPVFTIDRTGPTVTGVSSSTADGTYGIGDTVSIQVTFNENATVTGTPTLALNSGGNGDLPASGSGYDVADVHLRAPRGPELGRPRLRVDRCTQRLGRQRSATPRPTTRR